MSKVAIVSDSNSGITQSMAKKLGVTVMPMPFFVGDKTLYEDIDLSQEEFYQMLSEKTDIHTSMPLVGNVTDTWDELLKEYDEIVHIPMSSGLSGSCETAMMLSQDYDGKVQVVNNQRISVTQRQSVLDALALAKQGRTASEIKTILERDKFESSIYIMVDTLYYLKKGGRITPAAAALGTLLKLKPVLQIQGEKLDAFAKARTKSAGKSMMLQAIMGTPLLSWLASSLIAGGVGRFFMVCHERFRRDVRACIPDDVGFFCPEQEAVSDQLHVFLSTADESEEDVIVVTGPAIILPYADDEEEFDGAPIVSPVRP